MMSSLPGNAQAHGKIRGRVAQEVYTRLANDIVMGQFVPGVRLDEAMLAERFAVSRTPVREALKQLAVTGLVVYRPNRGSIVASMTEAQVNQMFEAIGELEAACAHHAALRMSAQERTQLRDIHTAGRVAMHANDAPAYDTLNVQLHLLIIKGAHNSVLAEMALSLRDRIAPFRSSQFRNLERVAESFAEHDLIVQAILCNEASVAYREMRRHLLSARKASRTMAYQA